MKKLILSALTISVLAACGGKSNTPATDSVYVPDPNGAATPTTSPTATATSRPTATAQPTATATGTAVPVVSPTTTVSPTPSPTNTSVPVVTTSPAPTAGASVSGTAFGPAADSAATALSGSSHHVLRVNGKEIPLQISGLTSSNSLRANGKTENGDTYVFQPNLNSSYAGIIRLGNNAENYLFHQGLTATDLPSSGTATYRGSSYVESIAGLGNSGGDASFNVDFGAKTISGRLENQINYQNNGSTAVLNGLNFNGTINGTGFSGQDGSTEFNGAFYGANGNELSGVLRDNSRRFQGFYGASKQQ